MPKLFFIGNSHIDPVWLWRWQDGFSEILATFRSALDRMNDFDDFKYTSACSGYYEFIEKIDPEMFEEIKRRVKEGRWEIVGGWLLQPDCNIPSGESFARHSLIGQRYFKEKFGVTAKTGYNVDSFGHNAALPKILKASGMENYAFRRPSPEEQGSDKYIFNWESDDGSSVKAYRIPVTYGCENIDKVAEVIDIAKKENKDMMVFYGVGNHGGGPTISFIKDIKALPDDKSFATTSEFFDTIDPASLPTICGELQHHSRGCYSALSYVKKANRACEENLISAEKLCVMANKLVGYKYPAKKLTKGWKNLLFNQFHDTLGGCCIKSVYDDASYLFGETMSVTEQEMYFAMQKIALNIDTLGDVKLPTAINKNGWTWEHEILGIPVVVFNPHEWSVRAVITAKAVASMVRDLDGKEIPFQLVRGEHTSRDNKFCTAFIAEIPPLGYTTYRVYERKIGETSFAESISISDHCIENSKIRVELDEKTGDVCRIFDKSSKKYIIDLPCRAVLLDETECDTWAHDMTNLGDVVGVFEATSFEIIEKGPVRAILRSTAVCGASTLVRDFCLLEGEDSVLVNTKVDFHEKHKALKFTFPMTNESVTAKIPYGVLERRGYTGEEVCGSFIASGALAVANDSKYGYDTENNEMRLTILRGAAYADHHAVRDGRMEYMDQGISEFSYSLFRHKSVTETEKRARELNFGPRHIMGSFHRGELPEKMSCFECDNEGILVSAIKQAENKDTAIIRCFEAEGKDLVANIKFFDKNISFTLPHNSIRTFSELGEELDLIEEPKSN